MGRFADEMYYECQFVVFLINVTRINTVRLINNKTL